MRRLIAFIVFGLLAVVAVAAGGAAGWVWTTLPDRDAAVEVRGIEGAVTAIRDRNGVPHIFAKSADDAYFALGYVHAQDRFWQMEMMRRQGAGRLAEVLGPALVKSDKWMRTLGLYRLAESEAGALSAPVRRALQRYADGVNARLARVGRFPWGVAAPELAVLRYRPEPWKPADSLVWGKLMAARLGGNWRDEILRARLARKLAPAQVGEMWPLYPKDAPATVETAAALLPGAALDGLAAVAPGPPGLPRGASNAWVVASHRTETRGPILANDPHLGFTAPVLWYLARIEAPGLAVTGATVPGVPFHLVGHNDAVAWGITNTQTDIQDLFVEQTDADGARYRAPAGLTAFETRDETIAVRGGAPVTLTVRRTRHGPVISDLSDDFAKAVGEGAVLALAATFLEPDDATAEAFYHLGRSQDWASFVEALRHFKTPQSNFVFAHKEGDIGFIAPGLVPVRKRGWGLVPSPGWDGETDWAGFVPYDQLPRVLNPPTGRIVNANNRITPEGYPHFITFDWAPAFRARRIIELLGADRQTVQGTARIQQDHVSEMARGLLPDMLDIEPPDGPAKSAHAMLQKWNGAMSRRRPEPLIFSTWLLELNRAVYADELGPLFDDYLTLRPQFIDRALSERQAWCDDVTTADVTEDCASRLVLALKRAADRLAADHGPDPKEWRWGDAHRARFAHPAAAGHPALAALPWLEPYVNLEIATDGGNYTVNRGASRINDAAHPFRHIHGPAYRAVYDLSDLRRSRFMIATGQSGIPFSPNYRDLLESWRDGRYVRLGHSRDVLANNAAAILVLNPAAGR